MTNFETLLSQSMQNFKEGTIVKGRIIERRPREVMVDIGYKSEGAIDLNEFNSADDLAIGQEIEVLLERLENEDGQVILSRQKAAHKQNWDKILKLSEAGKTVQGLVKGIVKGGLMVDVGVEAFLPSSQIDINPPKNLREFLGQTLECRIVKLNEDRKNVVLSRRELIEEERNEKRAKLLSHLDKGAKVKGRVKNLTEFGAFVDLDGLDGLLHVTDMTWGRLGHPSEMLQTGQEIDVLVLEIDKERLRVSLGLKQMSENPWDKIAEKYPVNLKVRGKITSLVPYGAFIQLEPGVEGLVHVSELSWTRRINRPSDILQEGQEIDAIVISVSKEEQKLSLSVRHLEANPWEEIHLRYPVGRPVKGIVRNTTAYGAFVELEEGIDGMIHVSDMSWTRKPAHASEILKKGDTVEAQVLGIDKANQRISLGLKQLAEDPWKQVESRFKIGQMVKGTVSKVASFGAFIQLEGELDGLVHISQISEERVAKVKDVLKPGQEIEARVIRLNKAERRIGLSIKAAAYSDDAFEKERNALEDTSKSADFLGGMEAAFEKAEEEYRPGEGSKS
ncbi:MAG: 30S ribosomal protein S1 [Verrucomicrobia bacterium]|nr:30S ribosomal protein S1 [Pseudomonadota bacterium]NBS06586.1 30S ribosomal protein S1 [Verrucomicrobiota bacterium]NBT24172.1 30S ribosomal protein S1 [bacterium]NBS50557.1 30S ribosomal protein S1 [Verrucomicrobiota bacterium]NBV96780.1 30S ribosomal protein S1 [Verrucomicrobiota bacterium]